jgi:hypothetical protein
MKQKLNNSTTTNLTDWKKEITELWAARMYNIDYLKTLVKSMPRGGCRM